MFNFFNNTIPNTNSTKVNIENNQSYNFDTIQKARQDLVGEIQAIIEYDTHIHNSIDKFAIETWQNILSEELTHVGELLALLNYLDPSQQKFVLDGINEFDKRMKV